MLSEQRISAANGHSEEIDLSQLVMSSFAQSMAVAQTFFIAEVDNISQACWSMARRFHQGGRLIAFGNGAWASDAQHVAVEFVHPVIVGKRALPAFALTNDSGLLSGLWVDHRDGMPFAGLLSVLARPQDIAMGFSFTGQEANITAALTAAREIGLLTLGLTGGDGGDLARSGLDFCFTVGSDNPAVIQETHETLYHVLWELVHVFFEHEGLLE